MTAPHRVTVMPFADAVDKWVAKCADCDMFEEFSDKETAELAADEHREVAL